MVYQYKYGNNQENNFKKSMSWHRMRRGISGKPDPIEYKEKTEKLSGSKKL
jgi:hypothetical protein